MSRSPPRHRRGPGAGARGGPWGQVSPPRRRPAAADSGSRWCTRSGRSRATASGGRSSHFRDVRLARFLRAPAVTPPREASSPASAPGGTAEAGDPGAPRCPWSHAHESKKNGRSTVALAEPVALATDPTGTTCYEPSSPGLRQRLPAIYPTPPAGPPLRRSEAAAAASCNAAADICA